MKNDERRWTIGELSEATARALRAAPDYAGAPNDRIRDAPDLRSIRYYTTLGLLDRAIEFRGRTALYGWRHLLQLAAIKRLQAQGLSLAAIQERLIGLPDRAIEAIAQVEIAEELDELTSDREEFWRTEPAPMRVQGDDEAAPRKVAATDPGARPYRSLDLGRGVFLMLPDNGDSDFNDLDRDEVCRKAEPLLAWLRRKGWMK